MGCEKRNGCDASCCSIGTMGGEPSVTAQETDLINGYLEGLGSFNFYQAGRDSCKFLDAYGRCRIYPVRPIDCRLHFCASESMESQSDEAVESLVSNYHQRHQDSYFDSQLIDTCKFRYE